MVINARNMCKMPFLSDCVQNLNMSTNLVKATDVSLYEIHAVEADLFLADKRRGAEI
jgi:hypothetical protein